jgi:mRNA interferase MazF
MRRGEIWTVASGKGYPGKPRPVVILQDDGFDATTSLTICAFTTDPADAPLFRLPIEPSARNGLRAACRLMVDKITTVPKAKVGRRRGHPAAEPDSRGVPGSGRPCRRKLTGWISQPIVWPVPHCG